MRNQLGHRTSLLPWLEWWSLLIPCGDSFMWLIKYFNFLLILEHLGKQLEDYVSTLPVPVYVLRTQKRSGLIRARLLGAKNVKGQVITFLDAHCECTEGWLEPLLARIVEDR